MIGCPSSRATPAATTAPLKRIVTNAEAQPATAYSRRVTGLKESVSRSTPPSSQAGTAIPAKTSADTTAPVATVPSMLVSSSTIA